MTERGRGRTLSREQARRVYNRIGRIQDWQNFYESAPIRAMTTHAEFTDAASVYEFGCGTGALARSLLTDRLGPEATYFGVDISDTMVRLASDRLKPWVDRAEVKRVSGEFPLPGGDRDFDRFIAAYVFDLLDAGDTRSALDEARRLLRPDGLLCIVGITNGPRPSSAVTSSIWKSVWGKAPALLGGCRPVEMQRRLPREGWEVVFHDVVVSWRVPSEVLVARRVD